MKIDVRREGLLWAILLAPLCYLIMMWGDMPERVPIHWNARGEIDGWSSRAMLPFFVGGLQAGIYLLLALVPLMEPRLRNLEAGQRAYQHLRVVIGLLMGYIGFLMVHSAVHQGMDLPGWLVPGILFFFSALGNYMYNLRSNYFIGIRTPWTLEYPAIWERTHRFGGRLWFWGGLIGGFLFFVLPSSALFPWAVVWLLIMAFLPILHSFVLYKQGVGREQRM